MSENKKITRIEFKNDFMEEEGSELVSTLLDFPALKEENLSRYSKKDIGDALFGKDSKIDSFVFVTKSTEYRSLLDDLELISVPYLIETIDDGIPIDGRIYNGVSTIELIYDKNGNVLGRMDGIIDAINLLENDKEIEALVLLNQFCIRTDVRNMQRMTFKK